MITGSEGRSEALSPLRSPQDEGPSRRMTAFSERPRGEAPPENLTHP
ncbi:hypothetical protein HMPREF9440_00525 [Sutterella parvirubra YIT 11816]|uniref:Uncharacterized protein n=1 Tax=Sutterella parvirubra YIT 11816 TaxID=762967 RepID=H3KCS2_9BURK|nr:hypothetical protein HMPREF9440_00525 [Sutterella parvirubra YIT 11816]